MGEIVRHVGLCLGARSSTPTTPRTCPRDGFSLIRAAAEA